MDNLVKALSLADIPVGATARSVDVRSEVIDDRPSLRVALSAKAAAGEAGVDFIDQPTFVVLPIEFRDGRIEVDIRSRITSDAPDYARGFAGIAYRISPDASNFESVYVRPLNGRELAPPPPRDERAVQYFAYPEWPYSRLREELPDATYEASALIAPDRWLTLAIEVLDRRVRVLIDGTETLVVEQTMAEPANGSLGLWVDIGTEAHFADLRITPL